METEALQLLARTQHSYFRYKRLPYVKTFVDRFLVSKVKAVSSVVLWDLLAQSVWISASGDLSSIGHCGLRPSNRSLDCPTSKAALIAAECTDPDGDCIAL